LPALLASACGVGGADYVTQQRAVDGLTIALEQPRQPRILEQYDLIVTLTDAVGQPVDGATVYLDLTMPAMPMGVNQPVADPLGGGRYGAKALFTMEGDWNVAVHASVAGREYVAIFDTQAAPSS
jgi:nitrogen fixation protein FixH